MANTVPVFAHGSYLMSTNPTNTPILAGMRIQKLRKTNVIVSGMLCLQKTAAKPNATNRIPAHDEEKAAAVHQMDATEAACDLKGAPQPSTCHLVRLQLIDALAIQIDRAGRGLDRAIEDIGQRCLACTIWPKHADQFWTVDGKVDPFQHMVAAKMLMQVGYFHFDHLPCPPAPVRRLAMVSSATPERLK